MYIVHIVIILYMQPLRGRDLQIRWEDEGSNLNTKYKNYVNKLK